MANIHRTILYVYIYISSLYIFCIYITYISKQALNKFYENVMQGILRHINFDIIKCVIIASPGFVREQFFEYMNGEPPASQTTHTRRTHTRHTTHTAHLSLMTCRSFGGWALRVSSRGHPA